MRLAADADVVGAVRRAAQQRIEQPLRHVMARTSDALPEAEVQREAAVETAAQREAARLLTAKRAAAERERDAVLGELREARAGQVARVRKNVRLLAPLLQISLVDALLAPVISAAVPKWLPLAGATSVTALLLVPYLLQTFGIVPTAGAEVRGTLGQMAAETKEASV